MASSGAAAWAKYFQGKGDVPTKMKKDSQAFDAENPSKLLGSIPAGQSVVVLKSAGYESKALIQFEKDGKVWAARVPFDNIAKPGVKASGAASLKPQAFDVRDKKYALSEYKATVLNAIKNRNDLQDHVREFLELSFRYHSGERALRKKIEDLFKEVGNELPLNDIDKDFGEVLGPVAIQTFSLLATKGINIPASAYVYVPWRPNEPLMDYALFVGNKQYTISAKSGTTTNVVKPADILSLIQKRPASYNRWAKTKEYKVLEVLQAYPALIGPIQAVSILYPQLIPPQVADTIVNSKSSTKEFKKFIAQNPYLKGRKDPTANEVMYECEKIIQLESKTSLNFNNLFSDAISGEVIYVKFELDKAGVGYWEAIASTDIKAANSKRIWLRSKNGYTRAADKMGIQV